MSIKFISLHLIKFMSLYTPAMVKANEVKNTVRKNLKTVGPNPKYTDFKKYIVLQPRYSQYSR